ncbi:SpoIIE family protein phosphatase [Streptomyces thermocoprophilus]|uniref:SpoIIE family protein phosphatase n=1 Tax=Streptomyces thermocoprophilus TaxID=78356 RepID=A0ABV5VM42_9ACTN
MAEQEHTRSVRQHTTAADDPAVTAALAAIGAAAYVVDDKGCIIAVNIRAQRLLARSAEELLGRDAHDLLHRDAHGHTIPASRCTMRPAFHARCTAQAAGEWFLRGDDSLLPVSWLLTPFGTGTQEATLVVFHRERPLAGDVHRPDSDPRPQPAAEGLTELERLALLAETTTTLTSTLDAQETQRRLVTLLVPRLADWAVIDLITEGAEVWRTAVVHAAGSALAHHEELEGPMPPVTEASAMPLSKALRGVASTLAGPTTYQGPPDSGIAVEQRRLFETTGIRSAAIVPLRSTRDVVGALTLGRGAERAAFTSGDLPLIEDIARRAALALDNARLYQRQRKVAQTMQSHLLPRLPSLGGLEMTARYLPAPDASQVGGDWYDAFRLSDGATALTIGDVVGHDLEAAAGMAQVRNMLRAYAWAHQDPPSRIVERLDEAVTHVTNVPMATMIFARVEREEPADWRLRWTNAGHPPPLLITRGGAAHYLNDGHGILLGTGTRTPRPDATVLLPPGSTLVLYTDGLIETHRDGLDEGLRRLGRHAAALAQRPLTVFADQLLRRVRPSDNDDDVALLALRTPAADDIG